jgi:hypothetical protein
MHALDQPVDRTADFQYLSRLDHALMLGLCVRHG